MDRPHLTGVLDEPVAFVDVETTGGNNVRNRIIEVGIVAARGDELEYEWSTLVNPGMGIPPAIEDFTGITDEMVRHAPFFEDIVDEVARRVEGRLFVAHNARFDYGFFRGEFRRAGRRFSSKVACTVKLSRHLYPTEPRHNLDAVIERLGLTCERRHRALPDAQALWQFWCVLRATRAREELDGALQAITQLTSLPPHLPADLPDRLPEGPGVYRFYGENDALLYVGKARDVRQRVLSHWQGATRDDRAHRLAEMVRRIEWDETAGELGALLLEARQVRELEPLYNRALKGAKTVWTIVVADDGAAPSIEPLDAVQLAFEPSDTFGTFKSERAARAALVGLAREHRLCLKMLGLEESQGSCFARQIGRCKGACLGLEPLALHTARLKLALAGTRLAPWPFAGPVAIRERSPSGRDELHVVDAWQHVATVAADDEIDVAIARSRSFRRAPFDLEAYRILRRYFRGARRPQLVELGTARGLEPGFEPDFA